MENSLLNKQKKYAKNDYQQNLIKLHSEASYTVENFKMIGVDQQDEENEKKNC